jgi:hypothetical protein
VHENKLRNNDSLQDSGDREQKNMDRVQIQHKNMDLHKKKRFPGKYILFLVLAGLLVVGFSIFVFSGCRSFSNKDATPFIMSNRPNNLSGIFSRSSRGCCNRPDVSADSSVNDIAGKAKNYIEEKYDRKDFEVKVADYGCHIQYDIYQDGKIFKSLIYNGGEFIEIF